MSARLASGRRLAAVLLFTAAAASAAGCGGGGGDAPPVSLEVMGWWNSDPSTVDQTGFQVLVDVIWSNRFETCFPLSPNLRVRANDLEAIPTADGDCTGEMLMFMGPFQNGDPITFRLEDGARVLGESEMANLFPGAGSHLLVPSVGTQVKAGDPITISLPTQVYNLGGAAAEFYWLDMPANAPPFRTFAPATILADSTTLSTTALSTTAPSLTGRAAVVGQAPFMNQLASVRSCTGFEACIAQQETGTIGPVVVEVVP